MLFTLHLLCSDAALGRLDANSIDDQSSMELCFDELTTASKEHFTNDQGLFLDVCEWGGIACDDAMHVEYISIQKKLNGAFNYKFLPKSTKTCILFKNDLCGTLETLSAPKFNWAGHFFQ